MTPKEKAKRYDEVLEELRGLLEGIHEDKREILEEDITSIFPELKESDDERVRKVLIDYFKKYKEQEECGIKTFYGIPADDILAWLEEQGDKDKLIQELGEYKVKYTQEVLEKHLKTINKDDERLRKTTIAFLKDFAEQGYENAVECIDWLEKQGEQKPQGKSVLEAINEEKVDNADKVEPKFKVGDWIIGKATNNEPRQISEITDQYYKSTYGGQYGFSSEDELHLWTILDAKAGDVLYSPKGAGVEGIFLIKGWEQVECTGKTLCSSIGYRVEEDEIVEGGLGAIWWKGVKDPFFPATKEQRDKLEKAMADAGYAFDFEKKELKKIDDDKVVIKKGEKPTTWSEKYIADVFEKVGLAKIVREQSNDALIIALQDAMIELSKTIPQPKQEWGEEDESMLFNVINRIEQLDHYWNKPTDEKLIDWLKSLRPRNTWKPSDAQMDALEYHLKHTNENSRLYKETKKLYEQLKKLK